MRCPFCSNEDSQVKDSRPTEDNTAIRRRRICDQCGSRFTTFERIQLRDLVVIKTNNKKKFLIEIKCLNLFQWPLEKEILTKKKLKK